MKTIAKTNTIDEARQPATGDVNRIRKKTYTEMNPLPEGGLHTVIQSELPI